MTGLGIGWLFSDGDHHCRTGRGGFGGDFHHHQRMYSVSTLWLKRVCWLSRNPISLEIPGTSFPVPSSIVRVKGRPICCSRAALLQGKACRLIYRPYAALRQQAHLSDREKCLQNAASRSSSRLIGEGRGVTYSLYVGVVLFHVEPFQSIHPTYLPTASELRIYVGIFVAVCLRRRANGIIDRGEKQTLDPYCRMHHHWRRGAGRKGVCF